MSTPVRQGVTIIIPVSNYAEFVGQAIESALDQTYPNVEVLVVNDGSTDGTPHVLDTYADRIRIITQDNLGISAARNTGLREASHDLVGFLDADDVLLPSMVTLLHGTLTLMGNEHALAAGGNSYIDASGRDLDKAAQGPAETTEVTREQLLLSKHFAPSTVLARRHALLDVGGFDEELQRAEDRDLWLRLSERYRLVQIPDILAEVRLHFRNMSYDADLMASSLQQSLTNALGRRPTTPSWQKLCWAGYHHECACMFHNSKQRWLATKHELRSLAICPSSSLRRNLGAPSWFRIRALLRFLIGVQSLPRSTQSD
jgi:glycosyltransferase involved in cell wall biosynthesis